MHATESVFLTAGFEKLAEALRLALGPDEMPELVDDDHGDERPARRGIARDDEHVETYEDRDGFCIKSKEINRNIVVKHVGKRN